MSKPELPPIPPLPAPTREQLNRALCADYIESIAKLINKGSVRGFSFAWNDRISKPIGSVTLNADVLMGPMELEMLQAAAQMQAEEDSNIPVEDISEDIKDHKCNNPGCLVCNNRKNATKA